MCASGAARSKKLLVGGVTLMCMTDVFEFRLLFQSAHMIVCSFAVTTVNVASKMPCQLTIEVGKRSSVFVSALESQAPGAFTREENSSRVCNTYHSVKEAMSQSDSMQVGTRSEEHQSVTFHHPSSRIFPSRFLQLSSHHELRRGKRGGGGEPSGWKSQPSPRARR